MTSPRPVIISLLAKGSQEVVASVRAVKAELLALSNVGSSAPGTSAFKATATDAALLANELSTVTQAARAADQAVSASAQATSDLAVAQQQAAETTARLTGEARTAAAQVANAVQVTARALRDDLSTAIRGANLGDQARTAATDAAVQLESGLKATISDLRTKLASGAIDPAAFKAQADVAVKAFAAEIRTQIAALPPVTLPIAVNDNVISEQAFQAAEGALDQSADAERTSAALTDLQTVLARTLAEFQTGKTTIAEFNAALSSIRGQAITALGSSADLTATEIGQLNAVIKQTEQLGAVGFDAILVAIREAGVGFKSGTITVEQYQAALAEARAEAIALAQATGDLSGPQIGKFNTILSATTETLPRATKGLSLLRGGMATAAAQAVGLTSGLGSIGQGLLLLATGSVIATGIILVLATAIATFKFFTTATREAREEHDKLVQSLKGEADSALPATVRATKELTAAAEAQERALRRLRLLRTLGAETPGTFAPIENELARRAEKELADAVEAGAVAQRHQRDAILETATALGTKITLGLADNQDRQRAVALAAELTQRINEQTTALKAQVLTAQGRKAAEDELVKLEEGRNQLTATLRADPVGDARRGAAQAADQRELAHALSLNTSLEQINQQAFNRATQDLESFFATRKRLIEENTAKEVQTILVAAKRAESRPLQGTTQPELAADSIKRQQEADTLRASANQRLITGEQQLRGLAEEERTTYKQLTDERLQGEQQLIAARGQSLAGSLLEIDAQATRFREVLNLTPGLTTEQRDAQEQEFRRVLELKAQAEEVQRKVDLAFSDLSRARGAIQDQVTTGQLTEVEGNTRIAALERERLPTLQQLVAQMVAFANALGDPALISAAATLQTQLNGLGAGANASVQQVKALKDELTRAFTELDQAKQAVQNQVTAGTITPDQGAERIAQLERDRLPILQQIVDKLREIALETGNQSLIDDTTALNLQLETLGAGADLAGQRFAALRDSIASSLTSDLTEFFTTGIDQAKSFGDAIRGLALSVVQSIRQIVAQLIAAQIVKSIAGAIFGGATAAVGGGGQTLGNTTQSGGFARGGHIRGRGTGTSDSILAWVSNGERVITAADEALFLRRYGWNWVERLKLSMPRFATGGVVSMAQPSPSAQSVSVDTSGTQTVDLRLSVDRGAIVDVVNATVPVHVKANRRDYRDLLGGQP